MRRFALFGLLCFALLLVSCSREDSPTAPAANSPADLNYAIDPELTAGELALAAGWEFDPEVDLPATLASLMDKSGFCFIRNFDREVLTGDIVHYSIVLAVGPGEHDVVGIHRVVRESRPYRPIRTRKSLFLVHGMGKDFVGNFLPGLKSPNLPDDVGFAVFMAQNDIDVWGLDNSYTLVPPGLDDLGFAADWGMDKSVCDIRTGLAIARYVRLFTGNGYRKMTLMGYSQGAVMGYAVLNAEAQRPPGKRSVSAFIPVDWGLDFDDPEIRQIECENLEWYEGLLDEGVYGFYDDPDGFYADLGILARDFPADPSPYFDGFTNLEVLMFFNATASPPSTAHWWAASFDEDGIPVEYTYSTLDMVAEFWILWVPMSPPTQLWVDLRDIHCDVAGSIWEDHLGEIALPVFSLEAAGGGGPGMASTLDRLVSADVMRHVVQLQAPEDVLLDFGHIDLFTAENAVAEAWQPTLDWIESVTHRDPADPPEFANVLSENAFDELCSLRIDLPAPDGGYGSDVSNYLRVSMPVPGQGRTEPGWSVRAVQVVPTR